MQPFSEFIWGLKYQLKDKNGMSVDTSMNDSKDRVAKFLASKEKDAKKWTKKFRDALENTTPAGRIMSNAGAEDHKNAVSLINCVVSSVVADDIYSIFNTQTEAAMTLKAGCGIGYEFSTLRPKGSFVHGAGAETSGPLSFMDIYDKMCSVIQSAGGRRGAQMATFSVCHPDVIDFITAKRTDGKLRHFNLSLLLTESFMQAVKSDSSWDLIWENKVFRTMKARELWDIIMRSTYDFAEPGILMIDRINKYNNLWFTEKIRATNPCVTGDTLILTSEGYKRIDSLVNIETEIWNGFEWSFTTPKVTGTDQEIIDFEFSDGSKLPCTPYHKFVLQDGSRVESKNLKIGSKLAKFNFPVIEGTKSIKTEIAYTQGFYSGDGQKDTKRIWLYEEKCDLIPHLALSAYSDQSNSSGNYKIMATMNKEPMNKDFVPSVKYTIKTRLDWLAGLMDSDGTVSTDGVIQIWSSDRDFLQEVKFLLNTVGASGTISLGSKAGTKLMPSGIETEWKEYEVQDCWRLVISANHIVTLRELGLTTHRIDINYTPQRDASRFIQVTFMRKRKKKADKVYCFTEDKNHTGIFNGIMTSQCGEQPLPPNSACLLGSVQLHRFVKNPFTNKATFDFSGYENAIEVFTRMLDNVVDLSYMPLESQQKELQFKRRHGMGYTGLGTAMTMLGIKYGSEKSIEFTEEVTKKLAIVGIESGINLAKEKGVAPIFDTKYSKEHVAEYADINDNELIRSSLNSKSKYFSAKHLFAHSHFLEHFPDSIKKNLSKYGSRFTHWTSIAPTGTISASFGDNCSTGIEPTFAHEYIRNVLVKGNASKQDYEVRSYEYNEYKKINPDADINNLPECFIVTDDLKPIDHVNIQAVAQKWIDSSISKTINVPTDISFEDFKQVYIQAYDKGLKGVTTFRFNPEHFSGVLVKKEDLDNTKYKFLLEDGTSVTVSGSEKVMYEGQQHLASNLADALKNGYYKKD